MATYVLLAGAWHGSWCWSEIVPLLEAAGHCVLTPDLIGTTAGERVVTQAPLQRWVDQVADIIRAQADPVVLVGHSRAGMVISEVAEKVSDKIELLIYICAALLKDGETVIEAARKGSGNAALARAIILHEDGTCTLDENAIAEIFYNETPDYFVQIARERLVPEPVAVFTTPVRLSEDHYGSVARAYIECINDRVIPIADQRAMQEELGVRVSEQISSDHSPFFSRPQELTLALERVRRAVCRV